MSKQLDHEVIDEMNTRFRMKLCELAVLQADALPLTEENLEIRIEHQAVSTQTGIVLLNGASCYVVQFVRGQGFWDIDRITAFH